jgi:putative sterol carrier protein
MELYVASAPAGVMLVEESGEVWIGKDGKALALIATDTDDTLLELLRGELPPVVAHLQGRLRFEGDAALALRVLFGLQENSPWAAVVSGRPS